MVYEREKSANLKKLEKTLLDISRENKICLAFSGGVDSSILLCVAMNIGIDVLAVTFNTQLTAKMMGISIAEDFAESLGAKHKTLEIDVLSNPEIIKNTKMRCYYCKSMMFGRLKSYANSEGYFALCDGTNADDLKEYRPGLKAKEENDVQSPIAMSGLTKNDIRAIGKELDLKIASKPSAPCLLTRFPYGTVVNKQMLETVEKGESLIKEAGFEACRLRLHGNIARIEIPKEQFTQFVERNEEIASRLNSLGISYITLDLFGLRSGSMDID